MRRSGGAEARPGAPAAAAAARGPWRSRARAPRTSRRCAQTSRTRRTPRTTHNSTCQELTLTYIYNTIAPAHRKLGCNQFINRVEWPIALFRMESKNTNLIARLKFSFRLKFKFHHLATSHETYTLWPTLENHCTEVPLTKAFSDESSNGC